MLFATFVRGQRLSVFYDGRGEPPPTLERQVRVTPEPCRRRD